MTRGHVPRVKSVSCGPGLSEYNSAAGLISLRSVKKACKPQSVRFLADQASATDGLSVEFSTDGTNWDANDTFTIPATTGKTFSFQCATRYFRVTYTNGAVAQTTFRLQTILKPSYVKPSSHRIADTISDQDDAELQKAVLTAENSTGFVNIQSTESKNLRVTDAESGLAIAKGDVANTSFTHKFGNAPDFDQGDGEVTIWDGAEDGTSWENMVYDYSSTADIDRISSSNAGDTQSISITGLDTNYDEVTQTATLNGQNKVTLSTSLIRVYRAYNNDSTNLSGHVFIYPDTAITSGIPDDASKIRAIIDPSNQQTEMALVTVPDGYTGYMRSWYASTSGASKSSNYIIRLKSRNTGKVFRLKHVSSISDTGNSYIQHKYEEPEVFAERTDIEMTVEMTAAGGTAASVSGGFDIVFVQN